MNVLKELSDVLIWHLKCFDVKKFILLLNTNN